MVLRHARDPFDKTSWSSLATVAVSLPALLLIVVFFVVPIGITGIISLTSLITVSTGLCGTGEFLCTLARHPDTSCAAQYRGLCLHHLALVSSRLGLVLRSLPPLYRHAQQSSSG